MSKDADLLPDYTHVSNSSPFLLADKSQDIATLLTTHSMAQQKYIGIVTIQMQFPSPSVATAQTIQQSLYHYVQLLRSRIRKTDEMIVVHEHDYYMYVLLIGTNQIGAALVQERLWEALLWHVHEADTQHVLQPTRMMSGYSSYPDANSDSKECLLQAQKPRICFDLLTKDEDAEQTADPSDQDADLPILSRQLGVPYLSLLPRNLPTNIKHLINPTLARELHCYPLGKERNVLTVALANPKDDQTIDRLQQETGLHIFPVLAHPHELQIALEQFM